jgi:hypothetical protein
MPAINTATSFFQPRGATGGVTSVRRFAVMSA